MEAMECMLRLDDKDINQAVDEAGGIDTLESLQEHENTDVYAKVGQSIYLYICVMNECVSYHVLVSVYLILPFILYILSYLLLLSVYHIVSYHILSCFLLSGHASHRDIFRG